MVVVVMVDVDVDVVVRRRGRRFADKEDKGCRESGGARRIVRVVAVRPASHDIANSSLRLHLLLLVLLLHIQLFRSLFSLCSRSIILSILSALPLLTAICIRYTPNSAPAAYDDSDAPVRGSTQLDIAGMLECSTARRESDPCQSTQGTAAEGRHCGAVPPRR